MKLLGQLLGLLGRLLMADAVDRLQRSLTVHYARYCLDLKPQLSPLYSQALILAEDHRFATHSGVDPVAVCRALWRLIAVGRVEGASTIEQQLARCVTGSYERTLGRKLRELLLAPCLQVVVPKADIPGLYLSLAYFGWRASGLSAAAQRWGVSLQAPTTHEVAALVARITYPEPEDASPAHRERIGRRTAHIERLLARGARTEAGLTSVVGEARS